ncbi:metal ABC transporter ATP-binding protein [Pontiella agarivorans]|uniref:ABC transporter ATP-binding protein n=1 Tax=Pontiella agarivorans TaxID=3038953 RepID=A0ABU5MXU9_9BACT|nr:ABC transporter ATP-binding protein [Pontiella agarivorans]MDZ8118796.1 ABC transporter ATP-binding protein [Pontiella agarivorans]
MNDPIITCSDVCIAYGRQEVLHSVNLQIPRGIFLPFTGPNGSGKTSLLRAMLGLVPIRRGKIDTPFRQTPAGYVPQHRVIDPLYPISVRQIVEMGLSAERRLFRPLTSRQKQAVVHALEELGMAEHMQKTFRELSGGMKQKVLIARALVRQPDIIIMDEPTSELDEQSEHDVLEHLMKLNQNDGKTVLMVHHDLELAGTLTDTICRVGRGRAEIVKLNGGAADA